MNYYNDIDPTKCAWLRQLIADGLIPPGEVDERSIADVQPADLLGFDQWHFFAGIGGWAKALELAGWPTDRPVCTASCPCQPFSQTGLGLAEQDPRHLWPHVHRLNTLCRFPVLFGEQVASKAGKVWFSGVRADLEALGYEVGGSDLCAAGVSAPHPRQRLFWVAYPDSQRWGEAGASGAEGRACGGVSALRMGDAYGTRSQGWRLSRHRGPQQSPWAAGVGVQGSDGKMRRIEPGIFPLVDGIFPSRVALIGGAGDAIVPLLAAEFVQAAEESRYI